MELFKAIFNRRSIREFTQQPIEFEKLTEIISAGMHAPSSGNLQNWKFILITEKPKIRSLYTHSLEQDAFMTAQAGIIVCSVDDIAEKYYGLRGKKLYSVQNCSASIQNMLLAAYDLGLGSCWIGAFDEDKVKAIFEIPAGIRPQAIILLGYSNEELEPKKINPMESFVYFNKYGEKIKKPHLILNDYSVEWQKQKENIKNKKDEIKKRIKPMIPETDKLKKQTKNFFDNAQKRINKIMDSIKDEKKQEKKYKKK